MTVNSDKWVQAAAPRLSGCPLVTIQAEAELVMNEFFTRTTAWREEVPFSIVNGQAEYTLPTPQGGWKVVKVHRITVPNRQLWPMHTRPFILSEQEGNTPTAFFNPDPDKIVLYPIPADITPDPLPAFAVVSLRPETGLTSIPDKIGDHFMEPILDGLLGRLMSYPNKPYSELRQSAYHLSRFRSGMQRARQEAEKGWNLSDTNWSYPGFARGRMYL